MSIFEKATREKLRFKTASGMVSTEDLWGMTLESLDTLAKSLNKEVKETAEESFIKTRKKESELPELKFSVVKHVIDVRLQENETRARAAEKRKKNARIMELIESKEDESLSAKSIEELRAMLEE